MTRWERGRVWSGRLVALVGFGASASLGGRSVAIALVAVLVAAAGWARTRPLSGAQLLSWRWANATVSLICLTLVVLEPMQGEALAMQVQDAITALLCWLLTHRAWVHRGPGTDRVTLLLGLLILCYGSVMGASPVSIVWILLWGLLATPLLVLSLLQEESDVTPSPDSESSSGWRVVALAPLTLLLGAGIVLMMPVDPNQDERVRPGEGHPSGGGTLMLSELGQITDDPGVFLRAEVRTQSGEEVEGPFYFPMVRLYEYSMASEQWIGQELSSQGGPADQSSDPDDVLEQKILLDPFKDNQVLAISDPFEMEVIGGVRVDENGGWWQLMGTGRTTYTAKSNVGGIVGDVAGGMQIPRGMDPRIRALALEWLSELPPDAGDQTRAEHLAQRLREDFTYTRTPGRALEHQSLVGFVLVSQKGHCTYFATTLALMLRSVGIPSRLVRGFHGGQPEPLDGLTLIRYSDAHAWVEARVDGRWQIFDGTPDAERPMQGSLLESAGEWVVTRWFGLMHSLESTDIGVVLLSLGSRLEPYQVPSVLMLLLILCCLVGSRLLMEWWRRRQREVRRGRVAVQYDRARELVSRKGWRIPDQLPPREAAVWLVRRAGPLAEPLETLAWLHYRVRYGGEVEEELLDAAETALAELRVLPRRRRA